MWPFPKKHKLDKKQMGRIQSIQRALLELRALTDADRAYVIRFHNGQEFLLFDPIWKCTCTHEVVRPGIAACSDNVQSLLVSHCIPRVSPAVIGEAEQGCMMAGERAAVIQTNDLMHGPTRSRLSIANTATAVQSAIVIPKHGPIGLVSVDYCGRDGIQCRERLAKIVQAVTNSAVQMAYHMG